MTLLQTNNIQNNNDGKLSYFRAVQILDIVQMRNKDNAWGRKAFFNFEIIQTFEVGSGLL